MRLAVVLIACGAVWSCARPNYAERWPDSFAVSAGPQAGYAIKRVVGKRQPFTLFGDDGSVCVTSAQRFADTRVGDWIACNWVPPTLDSTEVAGLSR